MPKTVLSVSPRHQPLAIRTEGDGRVTLGGQIHYQLAALGIPNLGGRIGPPPGGGCYPTVIGTDGDAGDIGMISQDNFFGFFVEIKNDAPSAVPLDHRELVSIKVEACLPRLSRLAQQLRRPNLKVSMEGIRVSRDRPSVYAAVATGNQTAIGGRKKNRSGLS